MQRADARFDSQRWISCDRKLDPSLIRKRRAAAVSAPPPPRHSDSGAGAARRGGKPRAGAACSAGARGRGRPCRPGDLNQRTRIRAKVCIHRSLQRQPHAATRPFGSFTFGGVALRSAGPPSGRVVTAGPALCRWGRMHGWTCREREDLLHLPG